MRLLVTGGYGFIGSNFIIKQINETNNKILNYDSLTYAGNLDNLKEFNSHQNYKFVKGDICDENLLDKTLIDFKPDVIVHFAAESHVDRSIDNPLKFLETNIIGTGVLLKVFSNYLKKFKTNKKSIFLHVSTDEVYGSLGSEGLFSENSRYDPSSPYSASKASSDHLVRAWNRTYKFPSIITNCSNNYGPLQFPEKLIPLIIANCYDRKPLPVYGDGNNIRDWLYVDDHCDAIYNVILNGKIGNTYNIGGNNELKNIDIVNTICSAMDEIKPMKNGKYADLIKFVKDRPGHDFRYAINAKKIKNEIGWEPKETFNSGIKKTIEWYLQNKDWWQKIQKRKYSQERLGILND